MQNLAILTQSHKAIAAKKKAKRDQIKEVVFDDDARREFLTGFHKRKLAKTDAARKKAIEREKQERLESRREQRRMLRERAVENAAFVESAYHDLLGNANDEDDDEWTGIASEKKGKQKEEEYEDEEILATVTVVEDFDPDSFIHSPRLTNAPSTDLPSPAETKRVVPSISVPHDRSSSKKQSKKKVRYETKADRKREQTKQRARRTEKAELAGGKASRKKGFASKRKGGSKR
ncbi:Ribosomal RNA-processing protein 17 [Hypsizygus marmoreus]|uniref:Ribosomal RNA-processing protein 17 n=1 Tax=Hypsizygus marmoreus TaxID=39966 RepID=A0A369JZJ6_HYPMA|nr:Ribosomal RNA-processing protein 17 [Hypsizygus marmoreus]